MYSIYPAHCSAWLFYFILFYFYFPFCWQPVEVEQWWKSNDGGDRERETKRERERNVKRERERESDFWV